MEELRKKTQELEEARKRHAEDFNKAVKREEYWKQDQEKTARALNQKRLDDEKRRLDEQRKRVEQGRNSDLEARKHREEKAHRKAIESSAREVERIREETRSLGFGLQERSDAQQQLSGKAAQMSAMREKLANLKFKAIGASSSNAPTASSYSSSSTAAALPSTAPVRQLQG